MADENKDQQGQQDPQGDAQQKPLLAGKFKSAEELEKGYLSLQQKLGDRSKSEPKGEEPPNSASSEDFAWKKENAALDAKEAILHKRKAGADEVLKDADTLAAVRSALGSAESVKQFEQRFDAGDVSADEVKTLARIGGQKPAEADVTLPGKSQHETKSSDADFQWMMSQIKDLDGPYLRKDHPMHAEIRQKVEQIRKNL